MTNKKTIYIVLAIASLFLLFNSSPELQAFLGFDDYISEDDFIIQSPALIYLGTATPPECQPSTTVVYGGYPGTICDDTNWHSEYTSPSNGNYYGDSRSAGTSYTSDNQLSLFALSGGDRGSGAFVEYKKDLRGRDIKTKIDVSYGSITSSTGIYQIFIGRTPVYSESGSNGFSRSILLEAVLDISNTNMYHISINGNEISTITVDNNNPLHISYGVTNSGGIYTSLSGASLKISYIRSRPYFSCEVEADEVVIRDRFAAGSTFSFGDLTYTPLKFCLESYPAIKRSFEEQGVRTDIQGQLTRALAAGESITVGENEAIEIFYIADYLEGMGERCSLDAAYDTQENKCVKIISEQEDIITINNTYDFITVGKSQVYFTSSITFGGKTITLGEPVYSCSAEQSKANSPSPRAECWSTPITYTGNSFTPTYDQVIDLDDYFNIKVLQEARYENGAIQEGYINHAVLTSKNDDLIQLIPQSRSADDYYVLFNQSKSLKFTIKNNHGGFTSEESGIQLKITKDIITQQSSEMLNIAFDYGEKEYSIPVDTSIYGLVTYEIIPYYKINNQYFFDNEKLLVNYEVVQDIPTTQPPVSVNQNVVFSPPPRDTPITTTTTTPTTPSKSKVPIGLILLVGGAGIAYLIFRRKKVVVIRKRRRR